MNSRFLRMSIPVYTFFASVFMFVGFADSQQQIDLTLENAIDIMMNTSYRISQLEMGIEQSRYYLKAERAGLKSKVFMNLQTPDLNRTSDNKWNSTLQRNEIVRENTNRWQMDLAVRQPVILFGYPTNGNVSVNYRMYRYGQSEDGDTFIDYYNRMYLSFEQPLFQPNELKNDIEEAELDLEEEELDYISDQVELIEDISDDYYDLFRLAYRNIILNNYMEYLDRISAVAADIVEQDSTRQIEKLQADLVVANTRDALIGNQSELRTDLAEVKQRLRLDEDVVLEISPDITITPITVEQEQAIQYGLSLRPSMRLLDIDKRLEEIDFEYTRANDAVRLNLEMTYGLERSDERYQAIWNDYDNSNSVTLNAYVPIWDWGRRKARIEAGKISLNRIDLNFEERRNQIRTEIISSIINLEEHQARALNMQESVEIAKEITDASVAQYENGQISIQDLLQIVSRQRDTEENFLGAYLEYRDSILDIMTSTYYDYENDISLIDKLRSGYQQ
ncbi:TolC family protein [candidate division KSB1 bacterium]